MNTIFISLDLGTNSSGNIVSNHELGFLKSVSTVTEIGHKDIDPASNNLSNSPFLVDYLTLNKVSQLDLVDIDLVHFYAGPFTNTIRYLKALGIRVSLTLDAHDRMESIKEFGNLGYEYPFKHVSDDRLWAIYNGSAHEADIVIVPSMASAEFLKQEGCKQKIEIIPHGVDIPESDKIKCVDANEFKVGYLGAYGPDKGIRYLVEAWSLLNYQDSTLLLAGQQSKELAPFIHKYATGGKYNLIGYIQDVADFYNGISIYVQPSVTEGWGLEVIEAMSYGRPVIVSRGAGVADAVEDGVNGFIVDKRDVKGIAEKIDWFKNHPKELIEMGNNARETSLNYDWSIIKQKYIDVWNNKKMFETTVNIEKMVKVETKVSSVNIEGHTIFTDRNNSLNLSTGRVYESAVTSAAKSIIKQGDIVIDLGANIGYFTLLFAKLVGSKGKVFAFEPDPTHFAILKKNVEINGYKNIILEQKAVTNKNGIVSLYLAEDNLGDHRIFDSYDNRKYVNVECIRLDDYLDKYFKDNNNNNERHIDLIKIDIEGAECAAFEGMIRTLQNNNVKLLAEFYPYVMNMFMKIYGGKPKDFIDILSRYGFKIYDLQNNIPTDKLLEVYNPEIDILTNVFCLKPVI